MYIKNWVNKRLTTKSSNQPLLKPTLTRGDRFIKEDFLSKILISFGYHGDFLQALTQIKLWMELNPKYSQYFEKAGFNTINCMPYFLLLIEYDLVLERYESAKNRLISLQQQDKKLFGSPLAGIFLKFVDLLENKNFTPKDINDIKKQRLTSEYRFNDHIDINDTIDMILIIHKLSMRNKDALNELKQLYIRIKDKKTERCCSFLVVTCLGLMHVNKHRYAMPIINKVLKMYENEKNIHYYYALYFKCLIFAKYRSPRKTALKLVQTELKLYPQNQTFLMLREKILGMQGGIERKRPFSDCSITVWEY